MNRDILQGVIGIVGIAIAFIVFPIVMTGAAAIISNSHIGDYTGLPEIVKISPLVVFVGILFASGGAVYGSAKKIYKKRKAAPKYNPYVR